MQQMNLPYNLGGKSSLLLQRPASETTDDSATMLLRAEIARCDEERLRSVRTQVRSAVAGLDRKDSNVSSFQMLISPANRELLILFTWS
jgi:hypothetical protein